MTMDFKLPPTAPSDSDGQNVTSKSGVITNTMEKELSELREWKAQATRVIEALTSPSTSVANAAPTRKSADNLSQLMVENPAGFAQWVAEQAMAHLQLQTDSQKLLSEFRQEHPELQAFETSIFLEAQEIAHEALEKGMPISDKEALEKVVQEFQSRLKTLPGNTSNSGQALQHMALKLDTGSPSTSGKGLTPEEIFKMPPEAFDRLRAQLKQQNRAF